MIAVTLRFLGDLRGAQGRRRIPVELPERSTVRDLEPHLRAHGVDIDSTEIIVALNGLGLRQWPPDRPLAPGDEVAVFRRISGGQADCRQGAKCYPKP